MLDNGNAIYFGRIIHQQNESFIYETTDTSIPPKINLIDNILVSKMFCGPSMISLIDNNGVLYLYNDIEELFRVKIERRIISFKFCNLNYYALSEDKKFIYEYICKSQKKFSLQNYIENIYKVNPDFSNKIEFMELPYYTNLLFLNTGNYLLILLIN